MGPIRPRWAAPMCRPDGPPRWATPMGHPDGPPRWATPMGHPDEPQLDLGYICFVFCIFVFG